MLPRDQNRVGCFKPNFESVGDVLLKKKTEYIERFSEENSASFLWPGVKSNYSYKSVLCIVDCLQLATGSFHVRRI